ncbi:hypothetical protein [Nocardia sp. NPDC019395]|uniref:hypothetical protein n=1 Tax=Nocardia sp. NPDC019395 TaxID=3154686 RepID=UPI00340C5437
MRTLTQIVRLTLAASAVVAGSLAVAGPAAAVATPAEACGNNYHEIDSRQIKGAVIHLLYNGSTNCVVTEKTAYLGTKTGVYAYIGTADQTDQDLDRGDYDYYAGPVKVKAPGECIIWGGSANPPTGGGDTWQSQPEHCN